MEFCELCNGLTIAKIWPPNYYEHAANLVVLKASAKECGLCKILHRCIRGCLLPPFSSKLQLDGAIDVPYGIEQDPLNSGSIKLQILTNDIPHGKGCTRIGIWGPSNSRWAEAILSVEEGMISTYCCLSR
jgi:hypothetical protein